MARRLPGTSRPRRAFSDKPLPGEARGGKPPRRGQGAEEPRGFKPPRQGDGPAPRSFAPGGKPARRSGGEFREDRPARDEASDTRPPRRGFEERAAPRSFTPGGKPARRGGGDFREERPARDEGADARPPRRGFEERGAPRSFAPGGKPARRGSGDFREEATDARPPRRGQDERQAPRSYATGGKPARRGGGQFREERPAREEATDTRPPRFNAEDRSAPRSFAPGGKPARRGGGQFREERPAREETPDARPPRREAAERPFAKPPRFEKKPGAKPGKPRTNAKPRRREDDEAPVPVASAPKAQVKPVRARFGKYGTETSAGSAEEAGRPVLREDKPLPSKDEVRAFMRSAPGRVGKTEISKHFGLTTDQRPALRELLAGMKAEGVVAPVGRKQFRAPERLPEMTVVEIFGTDPDGDALARPLEWDKTLGRPPIIYMRPEKNGSAALAPGERVLAKLRHIGGDKYEGASFKRIGGAPPARILGVFEEGRIIPTDRRQKGEWVVPAGEEGGASAGEIVLAEPIPGHRPLGARPARIVERLGKMGEPRSVSLVCIHAHGIPDVFPAEAVQEAEKARGVTVRGREDLRNTPLVTIDGEDARDFDDAVLAEPDGSGWKVTVAIADVAHYVRPDSHLDREAWTRGNSVYFPDRVVPMLPEALSNGWCSLRPNEPRGCLFVEMWFDAGGQKQRHRFGRGLMRSHARLTYEQAQALFEAGTEPEGLAPGHMASLYGAFRALLAERMRRGTLDLDIPERRVMIDEHGKVTGVVPRARLDSHKLIEEFMVAANVCAAEELERLRQPCMYRIHAPPSDQKMEGLRQFLTGLDISLPPKDQLHPRDFSHLLGLVRGKPEERIVNETVLRSQSQAAYEPDNIGHFGLGLARYAHFTSPIRRYADLLVHRALIRGLKLGSTGGLTEAEAARFPETGEHITSTERRAAQAERDAVDRYLAAFMAERVGHVFSARISGVTRFGLFVTVEENGASGLVPLASLPDDKWTHDEASHQLAGRRTGLTFSLGDAVEARLSAATPRTGGLVFGLMQGDPTGGRRRPAPPGKPKGKGKFKKR